MDPRDKILSAMAGGDGEQPPMQEPMPPEQPMEQMAPQQAVEFLQGFGISEQDLPMVAMAIETLLGAQGMQP